MKFSHLSTYLFFQEEKKHAPDPGLHVTQGSMITLLKPGKMPRNHTTKEKFRFKYARLRKRDCFSQEKLITKVYI